jgi:predicted phage terminase large subunit-like protein
MSEELEQPVEKKPKSTSTERMRALRARNKAAQVSAEEKAVRESAVQELLAEVEHLDKEGKRFKSEARSYTKLVRLYYGQPETGDADEELGGELEKTKKEKKKGSKRPNPSETRIRIQDSNVDPAQRSKGRRRRTAEDISYEVDDVVNFWRWLELRDRARKDLFWLGRLLGKGLYRSVHQITCDQFVPKNFGGPWLNADGTEDTRRAPVESMYFEDYSLDDLHDFIDEHHQWREREMMLLDSRGFYKSTIDGVDSVQWLLNCPDIRILIITGEYKLAVAFAKEIKGYFNLSEGQEPTAFHLLFPEYVLRGVDGTSAEPLFCPARIHDQKEGSLWVNSIVANLSGWHCDIKKGDDIVTDENSNSEEAREKIKVKYDGTDDLLDPHGFMDHIGTRYFTDDWYGTRLTPNPETGEVAPIKYHKRGCWTVKAEYADIPPIKLTEDMVTLNFPQRWTFSKLRTVLLKKYSTHGDRYFRNQQLNEPTDAAEDSGFKISFTEQDLRAHMYQREAAPKSGDIFIVWDWALSDKKTSDYSVGVVARLYKNDAGEWAFVILEIVYDKWKHSELAFQIVALSKRYGPKVTMIEKSNAFEYLKNEIDRVGQRVGYQPYIYWKQPSREENAKRNRIKSVEILLNEHRLHFVLGPWIDDTIKQFTQYTGEKKNKGRKDDIPDAISYLLYVLPAEARPIIDKIDPEEEKRIEEERDKQFLKARHREAYFGSDGTRLHPGQPSQQAPTWRQWLRGETGEVKPPEPEPEPLKPVDPRMKIFGNKGPWRL